MILAIASHGIGPSGSRGWFNRFTKCLSRKYGVDSSSKSMFESCLRDYVPLCTSGNVNDICLGCVLSCGGLNWEDVLSCAWETQ